MNSFESLEKAAESIYKPTKKGKVEDNSKKQISLLYAFNGTGKTRISNIITDKYEGNVLCFNAFVEDLFRWDNENYVFYIDTNFWGINIIKDEGLENEIANNFKELTNSKIEPNINFESGEMTFNLVKGDSETVNNIKISKGEESLFIWAVFYTILENAFLNLKEEEGDRSTESYNDLRYIIIDDPVSSIDDSKIISMATKLFELIREYNTTYSNIPILITTHHALFYNILYNSFNNKGIKKEVQLRPMVLKKDKYNYIIDFSEGDTPFGYHLLVLKDIITAVNQDKIEKYHFNLFRGLLEKTANFLGYKHWGNCINKEDRSEVARVINLYSHSKLSELEYKELNNEDRDLFKRAFNKFIEEYKWDIEGII